MASIIRAWLAVLAAVVASGCVAGQSLETAYEAPAPGPAPAATAAGAGSVLIAVTDDRAFVKSGEKPPSYLGKYRAGFGNPWDVKTENEQPLADLLARDLAIDVAALGFRVASAAPADRKLTVSIRDWNFDGYQNGRLWYDLGVAVADAAGAELATGQVRDEKEIKGTFMMGARGGFERDMPKIYQEVIRSAVRDNPEILAALAPPAR